MVRNNPALKGMKIPRTGSQGKVGILVTKTLIIAGDGTATTDKDGKLGGWLRAYDKKTGKEVGAVPLPGRASGFTDDLYGGWPAVHRHCLHGAHSGTHGGFEAFRRPRPSRLRNPSAFPPVGRRATRHRAIEAGRRKTRLGRAGKSSGKSGNSMVDD